MEDSAKAVENMQQMQQILQNQSESMQATQNIVESEAAYWVTEPSAEFTKAGLAIENMQNDYYNATNTYQYVREAINIMNPAPKK